jgi:acetyl-CoA acetyltransferase
MRPQGNSWEPAVASRVAVVGVGVSAFERRSARSPLALAAEAFKNALADAGLEKSAIDGLLTNIGYPLGVDYDRLAEALGLNIRYAAQTWTHGRFVGPTVIHGALVVAAGLASYVACLVGLSFSRLGMMGGAGDVEANRQGGGPHGEVPYYGMTAPGAGAAMAWRIYLDRYGADPAKLGAIPVAFRRHARLNPQAIMQKPLTLEDYLRSPYLIEPLRLLDFCLMNDGGACLILTSAERARDCRKPPVFIKGFQGLRAGREEFIFARPGLGAWQQSVSEAGDEDQPVYRMAGLDRSDIGALYVYDAFSPLVVFTLERFGFAPPGEGLDWVQGGRVELGGELPVNTNGGLLSEAHISGWNHLVELVRQLRGECGDRQVRDLKYAQWATCFGDSVIFGRE